MNKDKIIYYLTYGALWTLSLLPFCVLYALSDFVYLVLYRCIHYRQKVVAANLKLAFPEKSDEERLAIERKFYHHLCDIIVEMVKIFHFSDKQIKERIRFTGIEHMTSQLEAGKPVMVMLSHYGNWEWIQEICVALGEQWKSGVLFRPVKSESFNRLMEKMRSRWFIEKIAQKDSVRRIISLKQTGKPFAIGFICDQRPNGVVLDNWMNFFGQKTAYVAGAEVLGNKVGAAYVYLDITKPSRGHYDIVIRPIDTQGTENTRHPYTVKYMRVLESTIRHQPELWLWTHKRWSIPGYSKIVNQDVE